MRLNKRTLVIYNIEYEMNNEMMKPVTWKANVLCKDSHEDATAFISKYVGKPIQVMSIGKITDLDGISDEAIEYIIKNSGYAKVID